MNRDSAFNSYPQTQLYTWMYVYLQVPRSISIESCSQIRPTIKRSLKFRVSSFGFLPSSLKLLVSGLKSRSSFKLLISYLKFQFWNIQFSSLNFPVSSFELQLSIVTSKPRSTLTHLIAHTGALSHLKLQVSKRILRFGSTSQIRPATQRKYGGRGTKRYLVHVEEVDLQHTLVRHCPHTLPGKGKALAIDPFVAPVVSPLLHSQLDEHSELQVTTQEGSDLRVIYPIQVPRPPPLLHS